MILFTWKILPAISSKWASSNHLGGYKRGDSFQKDRFFYPFWINIMMLVDGVVES